MFLSDLVRIFNKCKFDEHENYLLNLSITFLKFTKNKDQIFFDINKTFKDHNVIKDMNKIIEYFDKNANEYSNYSILY